MSERKKRGGWSNPAAAENGRAGGRKRKILQQINDEPAFVLRTGDTVAVLDGANTTIATVVLIAGALRLTSEDGRTLTIILSE